MKQHLQSLSNYLVALNLRERVLVLLVAIAVIYAVWDGVFLSKQEQHYQSLLSQQQLLTKQKQEHELKLAQTTAKIIANQRTVEQKKSAIIQAKQHLQQTVTQLDSVLNKLVPPTKITELLRNLLLQTHGLKLVALNNEPVENISFAEEDSKPSPENSVKTRLYKHSTTLKLSGNYQQLYQYLSALESSEWGLYWNELHYEVIDYPQAEITIRVHTISTNEYWIGL